MHAGEAHFGRKMTHADPGLAVAATSVRVTHSGSILKGKRVPLIPNRSGRRQTEQPSLRGTKIPCFQASYNLKYFLIWNQSVAGGVEENSRQMTVVRGCPREGGRAMATQDEICASLIYVVFPVSRHTLDADSMANPEV